MDGNGKRETHFHFGDIGAVAMLLLLGLATVGYFLWRGLEQGDTLAIVIVTALVVIFLLALGGAGVLFVLSRAHRYEERREMAEQARWRENAQENLAIMAGMQKVQSTQNAMLLKQAREQQRMLPTPDGDVVDVGFQFDEALFDEMED